MYSIATFRGYLMSWLSDYSRECYDYFMLPNQKKNLNKVMKARYVFIANCRP